MAQMSVGEAKAKVLAKWPEAISHQLLEDGLWAVFLHGGNQPFGTIEQWFPTEDAAWISAASHPSVADWDFSCACGTTFSRLGHTVCPYCHTYPGFPLRPKVDGTVAPPEITGTRPVSHPSVDGEQPAMQMDDGTGLHTVYNAYAASQPSAEQQGSQGWCSSCDCITECSRPTCGKCGDFLIFADALTLSDVKPLVDALERLIETHPKRGDAATLLAFGKAQTALKAYREKING